MANTGNHTHFYADDKINYLSWLSILPTNGIIVDTKNIIVKKNSESNKVSQYTYTAKDVEIRNNTKTRRC